MNPLLRRLFIALPVDDREVVLSLNNITGFLEKNKKILKPVPPQNFHITLKFLGEVENSLADTIINAFDNDSNLKKIEYLIEGIGAFPNTTNPSVIWAGLKCDDKPLDDVFRFTEQFAGSLGFAAETRKFHPHLTLARIKKEKNVSPEFKDFLKGAKRTFFSASVFSELVLYESILSIKGAEYIKRSVMNLK